MGLGRYIKGVMSRLAPGGAAAHGARSAKARRIRGLPDRRVMAESYVPALAADGGRIPPALYGETIIPELQDIIVKMRIGEIAGPIKSKLGYHVIKKESERRVELEEARERIARLMERQKLDRYLQTVQEKFPVEVVDEQFK